MTLLTAGAYRLCTVFMFGFCASLKDSRDWSCMFTFAHSMGSCFAIVLVVERFLFLSKYAICEL